MPPKPTPQGSKKRKRNTSTHTSSPSVRKKGKNRSIVAESPATADDSEVIWQVRAIINERKVGRRIQYLLDWEPNSQTGETFSPTWQFSKDVGDGSIQEWNDEKERRERQQKPQSGSVSSQPQRTDNFTEAGPHLSEPAQHVQRQGRQRRVVNSSSPQPASTPPRQGGPASPEVQETPFFGPTEIGLTPLREPPSTLNPEEPTGLPIPQVHVTTTSGFNRDDYLVGLSQALQSSDPPPASSGVREPSSPPPIEVRTVIPDSQGVTTLSSVDTTQARSLDAPSPQPLVEELTGSLLPDQPVEALTDKAGRPVLQSSVAVFETDPVEVSSSAIVSEALPDQTGSRVSSPSSVQAPTEKTESPNFQEAQVRDSPVIESLTTNENSQSREIASPAPNTAETHSPLSINPSTNPTHTFSQQLREQFQSTILVTPGSDLKTTLPSAELSTSSAPQPPDFDTYPAQHTDIPEEMPETRRSLRASAPSSGTSGSPARTAPSTPNSVKNSRSIRAEDNARRKEREEKQQRESAALKEKEQQEKEAREAEEEAAAALSTSDSQLSENPISAIPADEAVDEPTVLQDAQDGSKLPDRLPSDAADKAMDSTSENGFTDGAARSEPSASESDPEETPGLALEQMEFIVPLPFSSQARDQYRRTVKYKEPLVERITGQNWSHDPSTVPDAELFVQTMRNIATHIDLTNVTTSSQGPVDPVLSMRWDCSVSTKFKFLGYLLNDLRGQSLHVVIICQPGEIVSILERFLQGNKISYSRTDAIANQSSPIASSSLKVTLRPATGEGSDTVLPPANLLLTLDHFIDINEPQIRALRQHPSYEQLAPVISLAVVNSVDHIERSLMPSLVGLKRLRVLVRCIAKTRKDAGKHDPGRPSIEDSAMEVARFVSMRGSQDTWPLPDIGPFDNNDAWDLSQGLVTMKSAGSSDSGDAKTKAVQKNVQKRRLEHVQDDAAESSKKIRMTPQGDNDASTTRISDSMVGGSSQAHKTPTHPNETASLRALLKATEERLQETRKAKDEELLSYQTALSDLQFRFEAQTAEKRSLASELTETKRIIVSIQNQNEVGIASIESFKETTRDLRERLAEARRALETSAIPEIAAMEKLRQEKEKAEEARAKAEKDKASQDSLNKYLAENYSLASTRAAELGQENEEYAAKNMALEKTASGEIVKVRQMYHSEQQKRLQSENIRLKQEVKNMSSLLQRKEEEHRNRKPGVGTRAGSVPRSPRVGPASRAGSPIPDRRIGVLKNNMNFQGQGRRTPKQPVATDDHHESPNGMKYSAAPVIAEPKPRAKPIELKMMESRQVEHKAPVSRPPEPIPPAPRQAVERTTGTSSRPFPCCFAQYNCGSAFTSKNEWKRHISTKHIQLGFWRCDMCPPSPGIDHPVYNDFNRKDLFTQHLRRMHAVPATLGTQESKEPSSQPTSSASLPNTPQISDEQITEIQKRCYRVLRLPPDTSSCVFCARNFSGPNSWEERLEHVGGHLERDRKNGSTCPDVVHWRQDDPLRHYLIREGLVEVDPRGGYRIGDGKPRRPVEIEGYAGQQPTAQLTPRTNPTSSDRATVKAENDGDSEDSGGRRRRGRPPKRISDAMDVDPPAFNHAASSQPEPQPSPLQRHQHHQQQQQQQQQQHQNQHQNQQAHAQQQPQQQGPQQRHSQHAQHLPPHQHPQHPHMQYNPPDQHNHPQGPLHNHHQHPHQLAPMHDPREGPPPYHPLSGGPLTQPVHMNAPANLQTMYEFRHGTFTKFQGTSGALQPRPIQELPPPALSTRAHGQPQLAPKPSPDPRDGPAGHSPVGGPQLAPKPFQHGPPGSVSPMAPAHHPSGFKAINASMTASPKGMIHVAPKPSSDNQDGITPGGRQLAPKPPQQPIREDVPESADGVTTRRQAASGAQQPTTPPHQGQHIEQAQQQHHPQSSQQPQPSQQAVSGAEEEEARRQTRGKSFREVVMS